MTVGPHTRRKLLLTALAILATGVAVAGPDPAQRTVDLRDAAALVQLRQTNYAHFVKVERILAGLLERPERAEGDWLQANFDAREVDLSRLVMKTSHPPRQVLRFTLDDTRYVLHVVRSDLVAKPVVLR
jgi:hypothetical protein